MDRDTIRKRLRSARVGIAGAGGLGSNCAVALVRSGVGSVVLADFDVVQATNLDRQYFFLDQVGRPKVEALAETLRRIDPDVEIEAHCVRLDPGSIVKIFRDVDVLVEAFDLADMKAMIVETAAFSFPDRPFVAASGLAGVGYADDIRMIRSGPQTFVGDFEREAGPEEAPTAPRVGVAACMEADAVLEFLFGMDRGKTPRERTGAQ